MTRARVVVALSVQLGSRFVLTGEVPYIARCEQARPWSSTPPLPAVQRDRVLAALQNSDLENKLPGLVVDLRQWLGKSKMHEADLKARAAGAFRLAGHEPRDLDQLLGNLSDNEAFWDSTIVETAADHGRYGQRFREVPRRYRAAVTFAAYGWLNAVGSMFATFSYGKYAGILRAPRPGDWVDAQIAACAAYSKVFLTEDGGQRKRAQYVWHQFGFKIAAMSAGEWLGG